MGKAMSTALDRLESVSIHIRAAISLAKRDIEITGNETSKPVIGFGRRAIDGEGELYAFIDGEPFLRDLEEVLKNARAAVKHT